ncbi:hypothetical protein ACOMHN_062730 [Nucella lapillus]
MTSPSSGYVSVRNVSQSAPAPPTVNCTVRVPAGQTALFSLKEHTPQLLDMNVYCRHSVSGRKIPKWSRQWQRESDFVDLCQTADIFLEVDSSACPSAPCFTLFFSFFPQHEVPGRSASGLWNCSARHYASLRPLLACNLRTECGDGRDEAGPCPYSSAHCPGMIALCGRCYTFLDRLDGVSNAMDINQWANNYCHSIGGQLSLPKCVYDWEKNTEGTIRDSKPVAVMGRGFPGSTVQQSMTACPDGQVTHAFLLCGSTQYQVCGQRSPAPCVFPDRSPASQAPEWSPPHSAVVPAFPCSDAVTQLSYTVLCDFMADCPDNSDEAFCRYPPCDRQFTCTSGQCLSFDKVCDRELHCRDYSDERNCDDYRDRRLHVPSPMAPPARVDFDGVRGFASLPMNSSEACPDSHYRCPGAFSDCLPVYTRCNSMYDCIDHQDEEGCQDVACPGFFRCRLSEICVHSEHLCDGWPHCPRNDDEMLCDVTCPVNCLCQGHTFRCPRPFSAALFPQLRYLDATGSGMTLSDVDTNAMLVVAVFARCSIDFLSKPHSLHALPESRLLNLKVLDLSHNLLQYINASSFLGLANLQNLSLSSNPLTRLQAGAPCGQQHGALIALHLSHTPLTVLDATALAVFPNLQTLNLTATCIHTISPEGFQFTPRLTALLMVDSPVKKFPRDIFKPLSNLRYVSTENYKFCCAKILPYDFDGSGCVAPRDEISSCEDLLQSWTYRGFLWLVACLSLTGNVFCCCARLLAMRVASSSGYTVFVVSLAMADLLMGVYIAIIGAADQRFRGQYLHNDDTWKHSVTCQVAGFLSLVSSEVSALTIWLITLDRFIVLHFPFSAVRFDRTSAAVASLLTWLAGCFIAVLPLLPVTSHWEFYSQTGICVPLPVTRREFKGRVYSFGILIVLNFILFVFIAVGQTLIYWTVQRSSMKTDVSKVWRDTTIARRLIAIAVTDLMCWLPIGLCGLLALAGTPIPGEVNVVLAIFVLPLNSAVNPFMYTFNTLAERRRKTNEARLLHCLESHPDLLQEQ